MKTAMTAIIKKDFRGVTDNKHLFASLLIVPLVLTIVLPSTFLVMIHFAPDDPDIQRLLDLLPQSMQTKGLEQGLAELVLNFMLPVFFLIIPIMSASIMAASSFVGEKEKRTLETLLYCPLSVRQIFRAKVLASFLLSMMVSFISFCTMMVVLELEAGILMGMVLIPSISWLVILLLLAPSISLIAVTLIAERGIPGYPGDPAGCRAVHRFAAGERLDPVGVWSGLHVARVVAPQNLYGKVYL